MLEVAATVSVMSGAADRKRATPIWLLQCVFSCVHSLERNYGSLGASGCHLRAQSGTGSALFTVMVANRAMQMGGLARSLGGGYDQLATVRRLTVSVQEVEVGSMVGWSDRNSTAMSTVMEEGKEDCVARDASRSESMRRVMMSTMSNHLDTSAWAGVDGVRACSRSRGHGGVGC